MINYNNASSLKQFDYTYRYGVKKDLLSPKPFAKTTIKNGRKSPYFRDRLMYVRDCWKEKPAGQMQG